MFVAPRTQIGRPGETSVARGRPAEIVYQAIPTCKYCAEPGNKIASTEEFPALTKSQPISFGVMPNRKIRNLSPLLPIVPGREAASTHTPKKKRIKRKKLSTSSESFIQKDVVHAKSGLSTTVADTADRGPNSTCYGSDAPIWHAKNSDSKLGRSVPITSEPLTSFRAEDEGFVEGLIEPTPTSPVCSSSPTDACSTVAVVVSNCATSVGSPSESVVSAAHSNVERNSAKLSQTIQRTTNLGHEKTEQDSGKSIDGGIFGSPDMPQLWENNSPAFGETSSSAQSSSTSSGRSISGSPPTDEVSTRSFNEVYLHSPVRDPVQPTEDGDNDLDEDEMEGTDLLHLISNSLDRFNAIVHPHDLSNLTSGLGASDGLLSDNGFSSNLCEQPSTRVAKQFADLMSNEQLQFPPMSWLQSRLAASCPNRSPILIGQNQCAFHVAGDCRGCNSSPPPPAFFPSSSGSGPSSSSRPVQASSNNHDNITTDDSPVDRLLPTSSFSSNRINSNAESSFRSFCPQVRGLSVCPADQMSTTSGIVGSAGTAVGGDVTRAAQSQHTQASAMMSFSLYSGLQSSSLLDCNSCVDAASHMPIVGSVKNLAHSDSATIAPWSESLSKSPTKAAEIEDNNSSTRLLNESVGAGQTNNADLDTIVGSLDWLTLGNGSSGKWPLGGVGGTNGTPSTGIFTKNMHASEHLATVVGQSYPGYTSSSVTQRCAQQLPPDSSPPPLSDLANSAPLDRDPNVNCFHCLDTLECLIDGPGDNAFSFNGRNDPIGSDTKCRRSVLSTCLAASGGGATHDYSSWNRKPTSTATGLTRIRPSYFVSDNIGRSLGPNTCFDSAELRTSDEMGFITSNATCSNTRMARDSQRPLHGPTARTGSESTAVSSSLGPNTFLSASIGASNFRTAIPDSNPDSLSYLITESSALPSNQFPLGSSFSYGLTCASSSNLHSKSPSRGLNNLQEGQRNILPRRYNNCHNPNLTAGHTQSSSSERPTAFSMVSQCPSSHRASSNGSSSMSSSPPRSGNISSSNKSSAASSVADGSGVGVSENGKPVIAKWRRACSFYLRGHCKKEDCEFAHDLTKVTCKFWELGECFKGPTCPFLHGYPPELSEEQ
ncbi:unnamed protein product [Calicophoron daubneyi]|uniref:C3H1-type domain-containing protein n=1 Tax=Calicophoron daubneyi TaxID=300641 RepID=A0AAV2U0M7_CALDB